MARGADFAECIENIDIGGPGMIRAAAKNHDSVTVVVDAEDYAVVIDEMKAHGGATTPELRRRLAATAYTRPAPMTPPSVPGSTLKSARPSQANRLCR